MRNFFFTLFLLFALGACQTSQNLAVNTVENESTILYQPTFKLVQHGKYEKGLNQLNEMFGEKLLENGFFLDPKNPEYLVQAVKATEFFKIKSIPTQVPSSSGIYASEGTGVGLTGYTTNGISLNGEVGKVIFLVQDAETLEIVWMGTGDGIVAENSQLKKKEINLALDQMLADLAF